MKIQPMKYQIVFHVTVFSFFSFNMSNILITKVQNYIGKLINYRQNCWNF